MEVLSIQHLMFNNIIPFKKQKQKQTFEDY